MLVLATFMSMIKANIEAKFAVALRFEALIPDNSTLQLKHVLCIHYLLYFIKDQAKIQALIDSNGEVKVIILVYIKKQGFQTRKINIRA